MIRSPLTHHRTRVPAIPPSVRPVTLTFIMDERDVGFSDAGFSDGGPAWRDYLRFLGLNPKCPYNSAYLQETCKQGREAGCKITTEHRTDMGRYNLHLTVTRPFRLSPKLLATFPWKLRRFRP